MSRRWARRLTVAVWLASCPIAHAVCGIKVVQWNIHGECFEKCDAGNWRGHHCDKHYPKCKQGAINDLGQFLRGEDTVPPRLADFISVLQLADQEFLDAAGAGTGHKLVSHVCGGQNGFGRYPFDIAVLLYDAAKWKPITGPFGGCMERVHGSPVNNYRAYIMQGFERLDASGERVVVVSAHFSHGTHGLYDLGTTLRGALAAARTERALMAIDSNRDCNKASWSIIQDILPEAKDVVSNVLHRTCCQPKFFHCYDRIIAIGFPDAQHPMPTYLPFGNAAPDYAAVNMHDPMIATVIYPTCFVQQTPQTQTPQTHFI